MGGGGTLSLGGSAMTSTHVTVVQHLGSYSFRAAFSLSESRLTVKGVSQLTQTAAALPWAGIQ